MGGFRPGAGSTLANAAGTNDGAARGGASGGASSGHEVIATVWHSWQFPQLAPQSGEACASCGA